MDAAPVEEQAKLPPAFAPASAWSEMGSASSPAPLFRSASLLASRTFLRPSFSSSQATPSFLVLALPPRLHRRICCPAFFWLSVLASDIVPRHLHSLESSSPSVSALAWASASPFSSISISASQVSVLRSARAFPTASAKLWPGFLRALSSFFRRLIGREQRRQERRRRQRPCREKRAIGSRDASVTEAIARSTPKAFGVNSRTHFGVKRAVAPPRAHGRCAHAPGAKSRSVFRPARGADRSDTSRSSTR